MAGGDDVARRLHLQLAGEQLRRGLMTDRDEHAVDRALADGAGLDVLQPHAADLERVLGAGDVVEIPLPRGRRHVQHGRRYAVVVQSDDLLALSTVIICPTSSSTPPASFHPEVEIGDEPTRVMCEMVGAVDARALGEQVGHLTHTDLRAVEDALELVLELG